MLYHLNVYRRIPSECCEVQNDRLRMNISVKQWSPFSSLLLNMKTSQKQQQDQYRFGSDDHAYIR